MRQRRAIPKPPMTKKEQQAEEQELAKAVSVLKAALRGMAQRKAARYEAEFLLRVRDMIDREIETNEYVKDHYANHIGNEVTEQLK